MFEVNGSQIRMTEGDYGITLPIELETEDEETITSSDSFVIKIFKNINTVPLVTKEYSNIENNTIDFSLTQSESLLFPVGRYYYDLDWFQNGSFLCNLIAGAPFNVKEKAGVVNES